MALLRLRLLSPALVIGMLAGLLATPAAADRRLLTTGGNGPVWEAVVVDTDGGRVQATLALRNVALNAQFGIRVYKGGTVIEHANLGFRTAGEGGVLLASQPAPGVALTYDTLDRNGNSRVSELSVSVTINPKQPIHTGNLTILMWGAGRNVPTYEFSLDGADGVRLLARSSGHSVHYATSRDFKSGQLNAMVGVRDRQNVAFARAQVGATRSVEVKKTFIGDFFPSPGSASRQTVSGPQGTTSCFPSCSWTRPSGPGSMGPGSYTFTIDGTGASLRLSDDVYAVLPDEVEKELPDDEAGDVVLSGVDAVLPVVG